MKKYKRILFLMMSFILLMGTVLPVSATELSEENVQETEDADAIPSEEDTEDEDEPADDFDDVQEQEEYDEDEELTAFINEAKEELKAFTYKEIVMEMV